MSPRPAAPVFVLVGLVLVFLAGLVALRYLRTSSPESKPRSLAAQVALNRPLSLELSDIDLESDARTANALARASDGDCKTAHVYALWLLTPSELAAIQSLRLKSLRTVLLDAVSNVRLLDDARSSGECAYLRFHLAPYADDIARAAAGLRSYLASHP